MSPNLPAQGARNGQKVASEAVLGRVNADPTRQDPLTLDRLGALLAEAESLAQLGLRATLRSVGGLQPGPESSVRKLLGAEFEQRVHEFGRDWAGPAGAVTVGDAAASAHGVRTHATYETMDLRLHVRPRHESGGRDCG